MASERIILWDSFRRSVLDCMGFAKNRGGSAKNLVFGRMGIFLAGFLADYSCKISRKPINRAFEGYLWNAKNFGFGRSGDIFGILG